MSLNTVIFDMDGLLIDSEPLWYEAALEVFSTFGITLTQKQYLTTTGLRTKEFVEWWMDFFRIEKGSYPDAEKDIIEAVIEKVKQKGKPMQGIEHIFTFFRNKEFKIGLATSSPQSLIDVVVDVLGIKQLLQAEASAAELHYGKPHPQVYLNCAATLGSLPTECICFEDSFNGIISAKAARMKCVVVPDHGQANNPRLQAADLKLSSLLNFNELLLDGLQ